MNSKTSHILVILPRNLSREPHPVTRHWQNLPLEPPSGRPLSATGVSIDLLPALFPRLLHSSWATQAARARAGAATCPWCVARTSPQQAAPATGTLRQAPTRPPHSPRCDLRRAAPPPLCKRQRVVRIPRSRSRWRRLGRTRSARRGFPRAGAPPPRSRAPSWTRTRRTRTRTRLRTRARLFLLLLLRGGKQARNTWITWIIQSWNTWTFWNTRIAWNVRRAQQRGLRRKTARKTAEAAAGAAAARAARAAQWGASKDPQGSLRSGDLHRRQRRPPQRQAPFCPHPRSRPPSLGRGPRGTTEHQSKLHLNPRHRGHLHRH